ncbi:unnamed protein product, partial [Callosobruchus maculatus]
MTKCLLTIIVFQQLKVKVQVCFKCSYTLIYYIILKLEFARLVDLQKFSETMIETSQAASK